MSDPVLISTAELDALMKAGEKLVLIDTRDPQTYAEGHLPGAVNLREIFTFLATSTAEGLQELGVSPKRFGSAGPVGRRDRRVVRRLDEQRLWPIVPGLLPVELAEVPESAHPARRRIGLESRRPADEHGPFSPAPATLMPAETAALMVTKDEMLAALDSDVVLLDVRDVDEWIGESSSPYGRRAAQGPHSGR